MSDAIYVFIDIQGKTYRVGKLWFNASRGKERASFQYDAGWLSNPHRFPLEPQLALHSSPYHSSGKQLFGAIGDSAPDRWGRVLMRRAHARQTTSSHNTTRTLTELDYLLGVNDTTRMGALRFARNTEGPFLAEDNDSPVPPVVTLPKLLAATNHFTQNKENDAELRLLLAPGSSLGGARPKASIKDSDGKLSIAKFQRTDDEYEIARWEAMALHLAHQAGLNVANWRLEEIQSHPILIVKRFDRASNGHRIPFLSAMSMLGATDHEQHSYLEIADAIRQYGAQPRADLTRLWQRIVFNVLISNTDDHLRNHGFLYEHQRGWHLSPAYDLNPTPEALKPRVLTTTIDLQNNEASLDLAFSVCKQFGLTLAEAKRKAHSLAETTSSWRSVAKQYGLSKRACDYMASAFEHEDLDKALNRTGIA